MARHNLNSKSVQIIEEAATNLLAEQPWFARRKNTLVAAAQAVLQVLSVVGLMAGQLPADVATVVAVIAGAAGVVIQASMKGSITPSVVERVSSEAAAVDAASQEAPLPTFDSHQG